MSDAMELQYYAEDSIIAWMPLPNPYKEDKKYETD